MPNPDYLDTASADFAVNFETRLPALVAAWLETLRTSLGISANILVDESEDGSQASKPLPIIPNSWAVSWQAPCLVVNVYETTCGKLPQELSGTISIELHNFTGDGGLGVMKENQIVTQLRRHLSVEFDQEGSFTKWLADQSADRKNYQELRLCKPSGTGILMDADKHTRCRSTMISFVAFTDEFTPL
jgi:hypothetical protein